MSTSCKVLAVGTLYEPVSSARVVETLPFEAPATLKLYLDAQLEQFWAVEDNTAVVFIMNASSVDEACAILDELPLTKAGLMTFKCTALVPLGPLGLLIAGAPALEILRSSEKGSS